MLSLIVGKGLGTGANSTNWNKVHSATGIEGKWVRWNGDIDPQEATICPSSSRKYVLLRGLESLVSVTTNICDKYSLTILSTRRLLAQQTKAIHM